MDRSAGYYPDDNGPVTKMACAMNLFMTGNAFVYYGEEIGMSGAGKDENKRAPMYWSNDPNDPDMCDGPPDIDELQMKYPSLADQMNDDLSIYNWFKAVMRLRNSYPAISKGTTEKADYLCDDSVAAFFRRSDSGKDLLIVMNLSGQKVKKDASLSARGFKMTESLSTGAGAVSYDNGALTMPAYSIAVFTRR
jgi:glycosidase